MSRLNQGKGRKERKEGWEREGERGRSVKVGS